MRPAWTAEQRRAIERREGELVLDASAGSGKTSVLVERFVRAVLDDGLDVGAILAITFTDKAAAELRERIRFRLRELGALAQARATEGAFISTIHGFCARVLRAHPLEAGIDPRFEVLDEPEAWELMTAAFEEALGEVGDVELIAAYGAGALRAAILRTYAELRSGGQREPMLPPLAASQPPVAQAHERLADAADAAARELSAVGDPPARVREALARMERVANLGPDPWPTELDRLRLPKGNGAALCTPACARYERALQTLRDAVEHRHAERVHAALQRLLQEFAGRYAEHKRRRSVVDFEDLELLACDLLARDDELRRRYASRFSQIMVDELQDTNGVQLELISLIAGGNVFAVGDAQQSIYGFRHARVELFEALGARLEPLGRRARLSTNFRSRPELLEVLNRTFEGFRPARAGRPPAGAGELVELLVADKGERWSGPSDGIASPWRVAEARALAVRLRELLDGGARPSQIVVLTRASTDLRAYERALEEQGIPTYLIGGRGYWSHPQVMDLIAYLRALCNPREQEAFYQLLASPLVGTSFDALVALAAAARSARRDPWWVVRTLDEPQPLQSAASPVRDELAEADLEKLRRLAGWFAPERRLAPRVALEELIERALGVTGYDLALLALPGGERRLANVRKLMRLAREYEQRRGRDLRGFLQLIGRRASGIGAEAREGEAPVEGEALDAVRLMTIHRAKGLEFEIVAVADLGREPRRRVELLHVAPDGRVGLRLGRPGGGRPVPALCYDALAEERVCAEAAEERRIFYVAMTRARERLILSGAARLDNGRLHDGGSNAPIAWIAPALARAGVRPRVVRAEDVARPPVAVPAGGEPTAGAAAGTPEPPPPRPSAPVLSYSALAAYRRCGYRYYLERVLGLAPVKPPPAVRAAPAARPPGDADALDVTVTAADRGVLAHLLLERLDFRRPVPPSAGALAAAARQLGLRSAPQEVAGLVEGFIDSPLCARLAAAVEAAREQGFSFLLDCGALIVGTLDVVAREPDGGLLVVDYKSDRLDGRQPAAIVAAEYGIQRLVYALAGLRSGARRVEVAHVFLERPRAPVSASFTTVHRDSLERELAALAEGVLAQRFAVSEEPCADLCAGCAGEGGLCSWPLELTRRPAADRLF